MMTLCGRNIQRNELFYTVVFDGFMFIPYFTGIPLTYCLRQNTVLQPLSVCKAVNVIFLRCLLGKESSLYLVLRCLI